MKFVILAIVVTLLVSKTEAHGLMIEPPQRGILAGSKFAPRLKPIDGAPRDFFAHFPAGDKDNSPGAGKRSQEREGNSDWKPFEPLKRGFQWRSGVCGDLKSNPEHLRGGRYYFDGHVTRTYRQGGIVSVGTAIIAHHNGYMEMHVCDVQKCGGEISESCFRNGHCQQLRRARNPVCDSGRSRNCAPIDKNYPGRWYLPCTRNPASGFDIYKEEFAKFVLPAGLSCDHCVLQWFWTAANNCNPPGVIEYFEGPDGPKAWGQCPGQAGALGGYTKVQQPCGGREFPEEYYQCADIEIVKSGARSSRGGGGTNKKESKPTAPSKSKKSSGSSKPSRVPSSKKEAGKSGKGKSNEKKGSSKNPFKGIKLIVDGQNVRQVRPSDKFKNLRFKKLTFKVMTSRQVSPMEFYIDGKKVWTEYTPPYYLFGNSGDKPKYWPSPILGRRFALEVRGGGHKYKVSVKILRQ